MRSAFVTAWLRRDNLRVRQDFSFWDPLVFLSSIAYTLERAYASFALLS
jgi:hypothetical protein